jgi:hypothetical protein
VSDQPVPLRVGDILYGFCGGYFGRDSYKDKRVEAIGADWVVARSDNGLCLHVGNPELLAEFRERPAGTGDDW